MNGRSYIQFAMIRGQYEWVKLQSINWNLLSNIYTWWELSKSLHIVARNFSLSHEHFYNIFRKILNR